MHCTDHRKKTNYVQMLVELKEILTTMYFCTPPELLVPIYTTYTQHADFILAQVGPPKVSRQ